MHDQVVFRPIRQVQKSLKETAVRLLSEKILSGEIPPGERLNESRLSRQFRISRAPIREALQQLMEQGLVVNMPRRGMFVVKLLEEDMQKMNSLRLILEAEALRLVRDRLTTEGLEELTRIVEEIEDESMKPGRVVVPAYRYR